MLVPIGRTEAQIKKSVMCVTESLQQTRNLLSLEPDGSTEEMLANTQNLAVGMATACDLLYY